MINLSFYPLGPHYPSRHNTWVTREKGSANPLNPVKNFS